MNFEKTIRDEKKKIKNEYFENPIFIYVDKNFEKFKNNRIINFRLWKTIHHDFDMFDESMWKLFQKSQWKLIRNVCYFQKFWLNHLNIKKFVKSSCIKRLNKIIFTNERWIKSTERKTKIIRFFLQSSNEKSNCCKNHRILFRQLQLQIRNQSFSKKINRLRQLFINVSIKSFKIWKINQRKISTSFFNNFRMSDNISTYNINRCFIDLKKTLEIWTFHYRNNHFSRIYHDQISQSLTFQSTVSRNIKSTFFRMRNRRFCFKINLRIKFNQFKHVSMHETYDSKKI